MYESFLSSRIILLVFSVKDVKSLIVNALLFESISFAGSMDGST
ncbi:MAG: hypothetical protein E7E42_02300 [Veillonella sp.]|nr:hypothetical protein [Veillonella sp.]